MTNTAVSYIREMELTTQEKINTIPFVCIAPDICVNIEGIFYSPKVYVIPLLTCITLHPLPQKPLFCQNNGGVQFLKYNTNVRQFKYLQTTYHDWKTVIQSNLFKKSTHGA